MLVIKELNKNFKNGTGVTGINLRINNGEIIGILGPNGAGKSTLLKLIFREYKKDSGHIYYGSKEESLRSYSFFTDQSLFPKNVTLDFFCMYNAELAGLTHQEARKRTKHLLETLELSKYKNKTFRSLSAGMQKKAMLAASLINDPKFIFLDEPTANLDVNSRGELMSLLVDMKNKGKTIVIASHIIDELQNIVDRVVIINQGKIIIDKKFDKNSESLEELYFSNTNSNKNKESYRNLTRWDK